MRKIKNVVLHTLAACVIYRISYNFSGVAYRLPVPGALQRFLTTLLAIASILGLLYLYTKYCMKVSLQEVNLGYPLPSFKWCVIGILVPCAISLFYILFTPGELKWEKLPLPVLLDAAAYSVFCAGLRAGVMEEVTFRGLIMGSIEKELGKKEAIMISSVLFAGLHYDSVDIQSPLEGGAFLGSAAAGRNGLGADYQPDRLRLVFGGGSYVLQFIFRRFPAPPYRCRAGFPGIMDLYGKKPKSSAGRNPRFPDHRLRASGHCGIYRADSGGAFL